MSKLTKVKAIDVGVFSSTDLGNGKIKFKFNTTELAQKLLENFSLLLEGEHMVDTTLESKTGTKVRFHAVLLAATRPCFWSYLVSDISGCAGRAEESDDMVLDTQKDDQCLQEFQDFIYNNDEYPETDANYNNVYPALSRMYQKEELTDVTLSADFGPKGPHVFKCHASVLAASSPKLADVFCIFSNALLLKRSHFALKAPAVVVETVLKAVYTGEVTLDDENVEIVRKTATHYQWPFLVKACEQFLHGMADVNDSENTDWIQSHYTTPPASTPCYDTRVGDEENVAVSRKLYFGSSLDERDENFKYSAREVPPEEKNILEEWEPDVKFGANRELMRPRASKEEEEADMSFKENKDQILTEIVNNENLLKMAYLKQSMLNDIRDDLVKIPSRMKKGGTPDMRRKENREWFLPWGQNIDGTPDMRLRENKQGMLNDIRDDLVKIPSRIKKESKPDMRRKENREKHLLWGQNIDGTPDMRLRKNKEYIKQEPANQLLKVCPSSTSHNAGPLKSDGTPDMRYAVNKTSSSCGPLKKDGTPDMRYAANKASFSSAVANTIHSTSSSCGPLKKDGTPDMRYAANKASFSSAGANIIRSTSSSCGPLKKDGTPDMRFKANRR
ncbi:uncharacterized protein LOC106181058 isoform X1 [Lingula anatina]|uniref:Uncharacterized protein LOC106181058 isoform X1 n=1 Tax=Lingula anatina TaxID=7574 RepID=A0A1S3KE87_LINAN|nr:uncharacterized protein LOC106181058 isoform X1 [Lingula anatina]|eukprot:XP_013420769.1 uncharacterized protein LOC106181058 isoform X1 [Lingula anatina]